MKKTLQLWMGLIVVALLGSFTNAVAQDPTVQPLPIDKDVRVGKLPNGLTYFIRHNEMPKERANFYIVQRVGSMQEEDNQAGLAHFLEHLAFNGTRHFPGKGMINYLESIGVKFGAELNAFTSFDETRYTIKDAPVNREGVIDSCILILRDWSDGIALLDEEIDSERGVIQEEWRQSEKGNTRLFTEMLRRMFPGLNYGKRMPIGNMDVIRNFTYQELRDYYHKWYRPDLQGLVIVGDIDVDYVENQIKATFADMQAPVNPAERVYEEVPDREAPLSIVVTDPEATMNYLSISTSYDAMPKEYKASAIGLSNNFMTSVLSSMMNTRLEEIAQKPNAPFIGAEMGIGPVMGLTQTEDNIDFTAVYEPNKHEVALNAIVAEMKRARDFGFTAAEYQRASADLVNNYENSLNSKANRTNTSYADEYSSYFTSGGYIPGIEVEYQLMSQLAQGLQVEVLNQMFQQLLSTNNLVVLLMGQEKEGVSFPTEEELMTAYNKALDQEVEAYKDEFSDVPLMENLPTPGKLLSEETDLKFGVTKWTFENGATVYLLPTDYKKNDIRLYGVSHGGYLQLADALGSVNTRSLSFADIAGVANFDNTALSKVLAGKTASASTFVGALNEGIRGNSSEKDVETMLQLAYLRMTNMRSSDSDFAAQVEKSKAMLKANAADPMFEFWRAMPNLLYPGNILRKQMTAEEYDQIDYAKIVEVYKSRFADASDFTFFLVGSFDKAAMQPLLERYIGSLPSTHSKEADQSALAPKMNSKSTNNPITLIGTNPMAASLAVFANDGKYGMRENMVIDILGEVLSQQFFKSIREDEGGTYGVAVQTGVNEAPRGEQNLLILYQTNPEQVEKLDAKIMSELQLIADGKIDIDEYFNKTVLNMEKSYDQNIRENSYWLNTIVAYFFKNENFHDNYLETLRGITTADVRAALADILANGRKLTQVGVTK